MAAAKQLRTSHRKVLKWYNRWQDTGSLSDLARAGRPRVISGALVEEAAQLVLELGCTASATRQLVQQGKIPASTSRSTLYRAVTEGPNGLEMGRERIIPVISASAKQKRLVFGKLHLEQETDPGTILSTDSSMFRPGRRGVGMMAWRRKGGG